MKYSMIAIVVMTMASGSVFADNSERAIVTGGDNAHDHAFGGHTGAGRGFHM